MIWTLITKSAPSFFATSRRALSLLVPVTIIKDAPLPVGSSLEVPKIVLNTSDKVQAQSDNASGNIDVVLQLLTDVA